MLGLSKTAHREAMADRYIGPSQGRDKGAGQDRHLARENGRGRNAERPSELRRAGWRDVLWRVKEETDKDNISMIAAGVAFYLMLAIFPILGATVSIYGLVADPADVQRNFESVAGVIPDQARSIIVDQLSAVASASGGELGFSVLISIALTLWSASRGVNAVITALNIAYDEKEERGFIWLNAIALGLTIAMILFMIVTLAVVVGLPVVIGYLNLGETVEWTVRLARWPILGAAVMLALAVLYRYAPDRETPRWRWVSWGAVVATLIWILGSVAFSVYVSNFADYNKTYGTMGAVIILLLWFNLSAYAVLLGAELNAEMEHQTARDTTTGQNKPLGQRDAYVADTVGHRP
ncbi:ribonuclease [Skermanella stibiiresistens SB22]|uniref:Ribonuclease n=1 Tax=Skermanella stibiiresistens SB22 TaxID=1385369 RepID=W9H5C8_9PROT|nr:YihY/virulence factor BrkB family protein [Skermanella stibiiresistens]EWY41440.1 ribonuclease [Skermanella stibiiresistens SB22]